MDENFNYIKKEEVL